MPQITHSELVETLMQRKGAFAATIVAETDPRMRKTGNPYVGATKISRVNGFLNWHYGNAVNRQRDREETPLDENGEVEHFVPEPRRWGVRITRPDGTLTPLVSHEKNGEERFYLELKVQKSLGHEYRLNGDILDPELVHPFLPLKQEGKRQQVENPIILRDYEIKNLQTISFDGETYEVVPD